METVPQTVTVPTWKQQKRTIKVPVTTYVDQEITENVPSYEYRTNYVNVPRTVLEPQVVTNYQTQVTQEPVTVQVPVTQTQVVAQQVNKVVEYQRFPINTYTVAGGYQAIGQPVISGQAVGGYAGYAGYTGVNGAAYATGAFPAPISGVPATPGFGYPFVGAPVAPRVL